MKKIASLLLLMVTIFTMNLSSFAAPVSVVTTEFGTFTYYINANGNGIGASTTITKPSSSTYLRTYQVLQYNDTGVTIATDEVANYNISNAYTLLWKDGTRTVASFATHEARGTTSIARYTSTTL